MAVPIRHTACGGIAMWYVGEPGNNIMSAQDIVYLDGTRPIYGSYIPACPHCGECMVHMIRCFDEDVDPGFDMQEALKSGKFVEAFEHGKSNDH